MEPSPQNTNYLLGRIEGKIDSFTQKLAEHTHRIDSNEAATEGNTRTLAVHDERLKTLEGKPSLVGEISDLKTKLAYAAGGLAMIAFAGPYLFKVLIQAL